MDLSVVLLWWGLPARGSYVALGCSKEMPSAMASSRSVMRSVAFGGGGGGVGACRGFRRDRFEGAAAAGELAL